MTNLLKTSKFNLYFYCLVISHLKKILCGVGMCRMVSECVSRGDGCLLYGKGMCRMVTESVFYGDRVCRKVTGVFYMGRVCVAW